jgi:cyanophycinase-like exopeptidase
MATARLLMLAGSGELSPRMAPVHRSFVQRLTTRLDRPVRGVMLDTPYGFQENADHLTERTLRYFRDRVGLAIDVVPFRRAGVAQDDAAATEAVRQADYVFAGPGSPTYALRHWQASGVAWALREKVDLGGALSLASAAAITSGAFVLPIYEIYKAGHDPHWLPGLDILRNVGLRVAVIPHFDNTEGAGHDTRYCYLGERRFAALERELPGDAWVLGIDENTALIVDLDEEVAEVRGPGTVTVRGNAASRQLRSGEPFPLRGLRPQRVRRSVSVGPGRPGAETLEAAIGASLDGNDVPAAVAAILELEQLARSRADGADAAGHALRAAILRLGDLAATGRADKIRGDALVQALVSVRSRARDAGDWSTADQIRGALGDAGLTVRDTGAGPVLERQTVRPDSR